MASSCYWIEPAQLHPWYKPATLKRKLSTMFPRSESPSPVEEYDSDTRIKRHRRLTLEETHSKKRRLPSPPQSPIEDVDGARFLKRQRCTTLERGIEGLSLTPLAQEATAVPIASSLAARQPPSALAPISALPADPVSPRWLQQVVLPPTTPPSLFNPLAAFTSMPVTTAASVHAPTSTPADAIVDIKMHSSSWYEPEKDRIVITDLDASSSDDEDGVVDDAPKLPRSVLQALLRGPERRDPRLVGLPFVSTAPSSDSDLSCTFHRLHSRGQAF
ncbi:hypothetical protein BGW80DRAFT_1459760 [Lactifluus volemus]|nr:hypothetical protein BGW80DRAFT_1459760 [Lactifluus volemus]